jgi:phage gp29-like protein
MTARQATSSSIMAQAPTAYTSAVSIERALARFGWLGDADEVLAQLGIDRSKLRRIADDDEVSAAIETRRDAALNTPWRIEHDQSRARQFFEDAAAGAIPSIMSAAWGAVPYGYSVFEVVYVDAVGGRIAIGSIIECPFEWFMLRPDGTLLWRNDQTQTDPRKFFAIVHQGSLRKPMGEALLAKAYWPWYFRTHGWRFWAKFLEQAAVPLLVGRTLSDKQAMVEMLRSLSSGPVAALDRDEEIVSVDTPGNSPNKFTEFEIACTRRIQRLILGQTLTSGTDGGSGNRALGEVHDEIRQEKRRADIRLLTDAVQRVLDTLAALNALPAPRFVMEDEAGLQMDRAKRDEILVRSGMLQFTRRYLEEKYGLEPDDFNELTPDQAAAIADVGVGTGGASGQSVGAGMAATFATPDAPHKPDRPRFTAGQQAIEDEIERILPSVASPIDSAAIKSAIMGAESVGDLYERLAVAMRDADSSRFGQVFERALFAADVMGYLHAGGKAQTSGEAASAPTVNLTTPITIHMPEQPAPVVRMEAAPAPIVNVEPPVVNVQVAAPEVSFNAEVPPAQVVVAHPNRAIQTVERDPNTLEVTRTVTTYETDQPKE